MAAILLRCIFGHGHNGQYFMKFNYLQFECLTFFCESQTFETNLPIFVLRKSELNEISENSLFYYVPKFDLNSKRS